MKGEPSTKLPLPVDYATPGVRNARKAPHRPHDPTKPDFLPIGLGLVAFALDVLLINGAFVDRTVVTPLIAIFAAGACSIWGAVLGFRLRQRSLALPGAIVSLLSLFGLVGILLYFVANLAIA